MGTHTRYEVSDGIATMTLDHHPTRNALSGPLVNGLGDGLQAAAEDDDVRVVVLTNAGSTFCAGADLKGSSDEAPRYDLPELLSLILDHRKPVIGRIAGHCTGGGVGLAAACDISVMTSEATLGFTEVRIGVAPAVISVVCLPKMRQGDALELFLSGEKISAQRAVQVGLINHAVPAAELDDALGSILDKVLRGGPEALAVSKELVRRVPFLNRSAAFEWTLATSSERFGSAEAAEGIAAFREKRDPDWVPR
ncbi:enoyl-CoA hydratase/isomerase family protein [Euzebya tangerina]|uniref:enoyl-CoA hydratase/isomerase family protein n=1 Tax=Euzebya tangerina TaxID=591198 RepID=UPI000E317EAF|nr:enoyl-CoA hydratase-related protein [Euzebya tangerina]